MTGKNTTRAPWDNKFSEFIVASKYIELPGTEIGCFPGIAYKFQGEAKTELVVGQNYRTSVWMLGNSQPELTFAVYHTFVERYIKYLGLRFEDVETFRFHVAHGPFPNRPSDLVGETISYVQETVDTHAWFAYEHISGSYLADVQLLVSQFTAGRLSEVEAKITKDLIPDRRAYLENPQDLPLIGIIPSGDQADMDQKFLEDLLLRYKTPKPVIIQ